LAGCHVVVLYKLLALIDKAVVDQMGDDDFCSSDAVLDFDRYRFPLATNKTAANAANTPAVTANMNG